MKLGLGSYACAWEIGVPGREPAAPMDAPGLVRRAASLGLSLAQIADNLPLERCGAGALRELRSVAADEGVAIELGTRGSGPDHLRRYLELCAFFSSPILRVVVDAPGDRPSPREVADRLGAAGEEARAAGVVFALENHDRFDARTFAGIATAAGPERVGICLDTVNSFGALEGPEVVIETLAPFAVSLHVKDFVVRRHPSMMGFEITGAPAGQGRLDIPGLLAAVRERGRDPNAIVELWPAPEPAIEATVAKERAWAEESVRYLRALIPA